MSPKTKFTKWECSDDGWKVWGTPDTTLKAEAHRYLACSAYASPSKIQGVFGPVGHEGRMVPLTTWPIRYQQSGSDGGWKVWHKIDWHMLVARLPPEDQGVKARATGEVLAVEQSSNNDNGDVENTTQVLAELKKQQREAPFKAPQMDAPVQYTVLAEIPATNAPADACTQHKEIWPASTAPLSRLPLASYKQLYSSYHTASSCAPRPRRPVRPRFRARLRRLHRHVRRRRFGWPRLLAPPPPPPNTLQRSTRPGCRPRHVPARGPKAPRRRCV
jgi:hypothetical protein